GEVVADIPRVISDWVRVSESTQYSISGSSRVVYYNSSKTKIGNPSNHSSSTPSTITTPAGTDLIRFHHNKVAVNVQINKGATLLPYDEYYEYLDDKLISEIDGSKVKGMTDASFEKNSFRLNRLVDVESSTNLINLRMLEYGKEIGRAHV